MEEDVMERPIVIDERRQEVVQELMRNVYMWMTGGLARASSLGLSRTHLLSSVLSTDRQWSCMAFSSAS